MWRAQSSPLVWIGLTDLPNSGGLWFSSYTSESYIYRDLQPPKLLLSTFEFWRSFQQLSAVFCFHWLSAYAGPHCPRCSLACLQCELLSSCSIYRQVADTFKSGFTNKWINRLFIPLKSNIKKQTGKFLFSILSKVFKIILELKWHSIDNLTCSVQVEPKPIQKDCMSWIISPKVQSPYFLREITFHVVKGNLFQRSCYEILLMFSITRMKCVRMIVNLDLYPD